MTFTIIGTGNIAWFFGKRLVAAGHHCKGVFARDTQKAKELAEGLLAGTFGTIEQHQDIEADVCFIAVSDAAIADIASKLRFSKSVVIHTAGAISINVLNTASDDYGVIWPIYSIKKNSIPSHRNIPLAWEASSNKAKRFINEMTHALSDNIIEAKEEQRKWLHLCAVITNNFINHLWAVNEKIFADNSLPTSVLQPIWQQTYDKIKLGNAHKNQTGPAIRGDKETIDSQVDLLEKYPDIQKIYQAITDSIQHNHKK